MVDWLGLGWRRERRREGKQKESSDPTAFVFTLTFEGTKSEPKTRTPRSDRFMVASCSKVSCNMQGIRM